jgi:hypothetical protein
MKIILFITCMVLTPFLCQAQTADSKGILGVAINSSMNGEIYPFRLVPGITYSKGKSQFELGAGFHPFIHKEQRILSLELNYKYYPNGRENKFNMYILSHFSYVNKEIEMFFPTTYNYLFLNGGYGFEISTLNGVYLGTNVSVGAFTYHNKSENPYLMFSNNNLFDEIGINLAFQFNLGYRFGN